MLHITDLPLLANAGDHTVQLTEVRPGVYRVETLTASVVARPVDELTFSLDDERLALILFRVIELALRRPAATVDLARRAVVAHIDGELVFLLAEADRAATDAAARLQAVKAMFETTEDKAWAAELVDDIRDHLGLDPSPARSFRELRDRHAAALDRDRHAA